VFAIPLVSAGKPQARENSARPTRNSPRACTSACSPNAAYHRPLTIASASGSSGA